MVRFKNQIFAELHERFKREIKLQGKSPKTIDSYARSLRRLLTYFDCHPQELTQDDLKLYFEDLLSSRSWSVVRVDRWGLRLFWERILQKEWHWPDIVRPPKVKKLPDILTVKEVDHIMATLDRFRFRVCLFTIYSLGLRLSEGVNLKVEDIDSARMLVHIRNAKGNKDRMIPLPKQTLTLLRRYWITHRNPALLFPSVHLGKRKTSRTEKPMDRAGVQAAFKLALGDCNIHKKATVHTLRHSYATHLVEAGVNLRAIQEYLGHANPNTTVIYAQLSKPSLDNSGELIQQLMDRFQFARRKLLILPESD
ncbi:MAG: site-specific integrase [Deltaproteobacteria bacterium]|jgi:integrase/recombinase XerD|nr:site-specific integrase [Deltaproteobacteria bacterium]MBT4639813.1 site-specific integrase [Deltaproteobacteria bacterium]MBT6501321.1 site-specific integrase [Deltaproteobacteria bacterium]MBT6616072.1 site-specific integrase [Deltaproteobacteria bacterium]MBT7155376.1 site-specific integrase [Deltaproteobacteria bacterium]